MNSDHRCFYRFISGTKISFVCFHHCSLQFRKGWSVLQNPDLISFVICRYMNLEDVWWTDGRKLTENFSFQTWLPQHRRSLSVVLFAISTVGRRLLPELWRLCWVRCPDLLDDLIPTALNRYQASPPESETLSAGGCRAVAERELGSRQHEASSAQWGWIEETLRFSVRSHVTEHDEGSNT